MPPDILQPVAAALDSGTILVAAATDADRAHLTRILTPDHATLIARSGAEALDLMADHTPDIILLDLPLPGFDGHAVCARLKADPRSAPIPVILVSSRMTREDEVRGLELGAIDYLAKPVDADVLLARVRNHLERKRLHDRLVAANRHLESLAETDILTGLINRRGLLARLEVEHARSQRTGNPHAFALCDLDHLKRINDAHGHLAGDRVIAAVAAALRDNLRGIDLAARWDDETFAILLPESSARDAMIPLERIRVFVSGLRIPHEDTRLVITVSMGVTEYHVGDDRAEQLVERANAALQAARAGGCNRIVRSSHETRDVGDLSCLKLVWHSHYASGHPRIDAQHEGLFHAASELLTAVLEGHPRERTLTLAELLMSDVAMHFRDEERLLRELGYPEPDLETHQAIHAALETRGAALLDGLRRGEGTPGAWFQFLVQDVVVRHFLRVDRGYFPLLGKPVGGAGLPLAKG